MNNLLRLLVLRCYPALVPWVILPVSGDLNLGWVDLVFLPSILIFVLCKSSRLNLIGVSVMLFLMVVVVSSLQIGGSREKVMSLLRATRLAAIFIPIVMASSLRISRRDLALYLKIFYFSTAGAIGFGLMMYFAGWELVEPDQKILVGGKVVGRVSGLFGNTGTYGHLIALFLSLGIFGAPFWCSKRYRLAAQLFAILLGGMGLLYSSSRGALLNFVIFAVVYLCLSGGFFRGFLRIGLGATALMIVASGLLLIDFEMPGASRETFLGRSLERFLPSDDGVKGFSSGRVEKWPALLESAREYFFTGIGYKNSSRVFDEPVDNFFLTTFIEMGILGTITYVAFMLTVILLIWRRYPLDRRLGALGLALFLATLLHGMTTDIWTHWATAPLVTATVGLVYARQRTLSEELRERRARSGAASETPGDGAEEGPLLHPPHAPRTASQETAS